uniref:Uncharacterized protein n=1 Tax=Siphoviridae sp. ctxvK3 TaxID=2827975 RepID=A0A8S5SG78_9CAUD|nr:MAG TPA: hypothetical protein [Siphoviridae sp. ctxvK3]
MTFAVTSKVTKYVLIFSHLFSIHLRYKRYILDEILKAHSLSF